MVQPNDRWRKLGKGDLAEGEGETSATLRFPPLVIVSHELFVHLDVDLPPMVGREDEGLERSLVEAARRREDVGRDVDLYILPFHTFWTEI